MDRSAGPSRRGPISRGGSRAESPPARYFAAAVESLEQGTSASRGVVAACVRATSFELSEGDRVRSPEDHAMSGVSRNRRCLALFVGTALAQQSQLPPRDQPRNQRAAATGVITGCQAADRGAIAGREIRLLSKS